MSNRFESLCVAGRWGAHTTPQAGVTTLGRYWTTTSRSSLKTRSVRARPYASVASTSDETLTMTAGRARVLDPLDPASAVGDPYAASVLGLVVGRIAIGHVDDVIGYGQIGRDLPSSWSLQGRVLVSIEPDQRLTADSDRVLEATGSWANEHDLPDALRRARVEPVRLDDGAPIEAVRLATDAWASDDEPPGCAIGLTTPVGPVAMPGWWDADHGSAVVRRDVLCRLSPIMGAGACITIDRHADRRADEKTGLILRGRPALRRLPRTHPLADDHVGIVIDVDRVTWWHGFESGTTAAGRHASV